MLTSLAIAPQWAHFLYCYYDSARAGRRPEGSGASVPPPFGGDGANLEFQVSLVYTVLTSGPLSCGKLVTAPAWPAHPDWLAKLLQVLGTKIEP